MEYLTGLNDAAQSNDGDQCFEYVNSLHGEYLYTNGLGFFISRMKENSDIYDNVNWFLCSAI